MNQAIVQAADEFGIEIPEFCVSGYVDEKVFGHKWFIGSDGVVDAKAFAESLDHYIKELNDDYKVERRSALKEMKLEVLPVSLFYDWMRKLGKEGGQNKFPRVLKPAQCEDWEAFIKSVNV